MLKIFLKRIICSIFGESAVLCFVLICASLRHRGCRFVFFVILKETDVRMDNDWVLVYVCSFFSLLDRLNNYVIFYLYDWRLKNANKALNCDNYFYLLISFKLYVFLYIRYFRAFYYYIELTFLPLFFF